MPYIPVWRGPTVLNSRTVTIRARRSRCRPCAVDSPNPLAIAYAQRDLNGEPRIRSESSLSAPEEFFP